MADKLTIRVYGLAELLDALSLMSDPDRLNARLTDASRRAAQLVVDRTRALANALGHGASIKGAALLTVDATATGADVVIDPERHPAMIGGLFGAHHDRPRRRVRRVNGSDVSGLYKGFNQFPEPPMRPPLPWQAFKQERDRIYQQYLDDLTAVLTQTDLGPTEAP